MKVGVFYSYFPHEDLVDWPAVLRRAAADGAEQIELSSMRLLAQSKEVRRELVRTAKELGLSYTFCTSLPADGDVASDDPAQRQRGIDFIRANLDVIHEMGGEVVGGMLHGSTRKPGVPVDNATRQRRLENSARSVEQMAAAAKSAGVTLGLELCNRYENTMLNTVEQGLEFLNMVDCPNVGLHLDTYHMNVEEDDIAAAIVQARGKIVNVHICENNRKLPGMGHINWREVLLALGAAGYDGALAMECFAVPFNIWTNNMCLWRDYVREGIDEDLIRSTAEFKALLCRLNLRSAETETGGKRN